MTNLELAMMVVNTLLTMILFIMLAMMLNSQQRIIDTQQYEESDRRHYKEQYLHDTIEQLKLLTEYVASSKEARAELAMASEALTTFLHDPVKKHRCIHRAMCMLSSAAIKLKNCDDLENACVAEQLMAAILHA